ncbi:hypothetical protein U2F26_12425 [Micromonospora sp. 4G57]|uniref:Methylamine utilisation protein MauE domain-containing protein n=1 Tax=Micromonospora sicca TaxID=2202420 RepID=A0ABU5J8U6_9ACTN|nr:MULTISPECIES: MauE/DoxX family redox-associated membrane protein [unclassified Micromonospora]MDZ5443536.1 hypothetical protein [Micromonospora sp. 4G57]MDZ5488991.1 hypothetical protein [Micromonospora sp. 4G53]
MLRVGRHVQVLGAWHPDTNEIDIATVYTAAWRQAPGAVRTRASACRPERRPQHRLLPAYRLLGGVELTLGGLLLLPPVLRVEAVAATVLAVVRVAYLGYARRAAPTSSCGCLSARATPVSGS